MDISWVLTTRESLVRPTEDSKKRKERGYVFKKHGMVGWGAKYTHLTRTHSSLKGCTVIWDKYRAELILGGNKWLELRRGDWLWILFWRIFIRQGRENTLGWENENKQKCEDKKVQEFWRDQWILYSPPREWGWQGHSGQILKDLWMPW